MKISSYKLLAVSAVSLFIWSAASAGVVRGVVNDASGEPLPDATLRVLQQRDSTFVTGAAADVAGRFSISNLKAGKYIIQAGYIGYEHGYQNVTVTADGTVKMKPFALQESSVMLKETTVVGVKTPIKVMEDTIEYNSDSYKTQPNAVVEDLLKRLPGVEVDSDGKITANGQEVKKILIDGKEFFSDDPAVASKNLPVNMVDKLQVVNRKSDLARLTGVDDGEDETVINLTVKKGMKNGWFGTVEAGYGTDDRYKASAIVNRFWGDGNQMTILGSANNINESGFTDGNGGRFSRFGGMNGINTTQSGGLNFNVGNKEIFRIGGNVLYSHSDRDVRNRKNQESLKESNAVGLETSEKQSRDKGNNVRADFRLQWNPDSFNVFEFRPRMSYNENTSFSHENSTSYTQEDQNKQRQEINIATNRNNSHGTSWEFGGSFIYSHKFKSHKGRSFSLHGSYSFSNVNEFSRSYSNNLFKLMNDSVLELDQFDDNHRWTNSIFARATWTEPLGDVKNGRFINISYNMSYRWNNADKLVYNLDTEMLRQLYNIDSYDNLLGNGALLTEQMRNAWIDQDNSNRFRNDAFNQTVRLSFRQVTKAYNLEVGLGVVPSMSRSINLMNSAKTIPTRWVWNYAPMLRYRHKFSKTTSLNIDYFGRTSQPTMVQLQPVADTSDPLRIVIGNPELLPSFNHSIRLRYQTFNADKQRSIMAMAFANVTQNSIVSNIMTNRETGGRTTYYRNANGVWNLFAMAMYSRPLSNKAWTISSHLGFNNSASVAYNDSVRNNNNTMRVNFSPSIAFRPQNLELELRPRYSIQYTTGSMQQSTNRTVHTYGGMFNATYYTPFGIVLNSDLTYSATSGYSAGYDTNQWMWNAQISYQFLKGKAATIAVKAYDLLQQRSNIQRTVNANYMTDNLYNSLTRYFMVTFTYKFNTFGKGKTPESRGFSGDEERRGPRGPMGGPMGGPGGRRRF